MFTHVPLPPQLGIEGVPQTVAEQVQRQNDQADHQRGEHQLEGVRLKSAAGLVGKAAQRGHRLGHTQAKEAQVALGEDGGRNLQGHGNDDDRQAVGQDVLAKDAAGLGADGAGRQNVLVLLDGQNLTAHQTGHAHPVQQAEHDEQREHVGAQFREHRAGDGGAQRFSQDHRQQYDHQQVRQRIDDVADTHHHKVHLAAGVTGDGAVEHADDHDQDAGEQTNGQGHAGAVDDAGKVVTAHLVGAEDVGEQLFAGLLHVFQFVFRPGEGGEVGGGLVALAAHFQDLVVAVGDDHGGNDDGDDQQHQNDDGAHRQGVAHEFLHAVPEEGGGFAHDLLLALLFLGGGAEFCQIDLAAEQMLFKRFVHKSVSLVKSDARVDELVHDVRDEVRGHHQDGQEDGHAHDEGVVPVVDGGHEVRAQAAGGEDGLHHHGAGDDERHHGADVGHDGDEGVAQGVLEDHLIGGDALGAGGADVILVQGVQHAGLGQTGDVGHGVHRKADDRQDVVGVLGAPGGHPAQLDGEHQQQQGGQHEAGGRSGQSGEEHDDAVDDFAAVQRGHRAKHQAEGDGHRRRRQAQLRADLHAGGDGLKHVAAGLEADAEVMVEQQPAHVVHILHRHGLVQAVAGLQRRHNGGAQRLFRAERAARNGIHREEGDGADDEDGQDRQKYALHHIFCHKITP